MCENLEAAILCFFVYVCLCYGGLVTIVVSKWGRGYFASSFAAMQFFFLYAVYGAF